MKLKAYILSVLVAGLLCLAGCGQKGDLYLPDPSEQAEQSKKKKVED